MSQYLSHSATDVASIDCNSLKAIHSRTLGNEASAPPSRRKAQHPCLSDLIPLSSQISTRPEAVHAIVSASILPFAKVLGLQVTSLPPVQVAQSHITTGIDK